MLLKDLPLWLQEKAIQHTKDYWISVNDETEAKNRLVGSVINMFCFVTARRKDGLEWDKINKGDFPAQPNHIINDYSIY